MKCPNCKQEMILEDNRTDNDREIYGEITYWCEQCRYEYDEYGSKL
jgi:transposase-like protein